MTRTLRVSTALTLSLATTAQAQSASEVLATYSDTSCCQAAFRRLTPVDAETARGPLFTPQGVPTFS
jgi:hypothetical protein